MPPASRFPRRNWPTDLEMIKARLAASQPAHEALRAGGGTVRTACTWIPARRDMAIGSRTPNTRAAAQPFVVPEVAPDPVHHHPGPLAQAK
jgi:hypothetical protein